MAAVFTKAIRDRWAGMAVASVSLGMLLVFAMSVYRNIDLSVYTDLPEALRDLMGIPVDADVATLAYGAMLTSFGALTLGGVAISIGSGSIAGEERNGTMGLLLANPTSRRQVLASKAGALVTLVVAASFVLWGAAALAPRILGVDIGGTHLGAIMAHLGVSTLFYGFLALAIGAWTGNRSLASGVSAGVMVGSFVLVGLLPLVDALADVPKALPWYYYEGSDPLNNGISWGHLTVLAAAIALASVGAVVGVERRDLRGRTTGVTLLDRIRRLPVTRRLGERLAGSARVSHIWTRTASEHQGVLFITAGLMFSVMGVAMGPLYRSIEGGFATAAADFPDTMLAVVGGAGDLSTAQGWYQVETFGLMTPIAVILVAIVAARSLATEQADGTMGLLLANPVPRWRIVVEKAATMGLYTVTVGAATGAGVALGVVIAGLDVSLANVAATSLLATLLGLVFGGLSLLLCAATGRAGVSVYATAGAALVFHLANGFLPLDDRLAGYAKWSPFHYYLGGDPLNNGLDWGHAALLAGLAAACIALAVLVFQRRDIRQG